MSQPCRIHALELGPMENFVYLLEDVDSRRAAVVDPACLHVLAILLSEEGEPLGCSSWPA